MRKPLTGVALGVMLCIALTGCGDGADSQGQGAEDFAYITDASPAAPNGGEGAGGPTELPTVAAMGDDRFWQLIDQSGPSAGASVEDQTENLTTILAGLPAQEIAAFDVAFAAHQQELYSWDLWGAAYLLMGGCSDDCFTDFRSWVIAQGQDYFEAVPADPQAVADGRLENTGQVGEAELLSYAAMDAYVEATGREIFTDYPSHPGLETATEPAGQEWDEDDQDALRARYPKLNPLPH
ncbi:DUF4240 domain-containing protein [uncultured Citricoccus sp.]|uniref:DUF4240 domain-containing protein n=1 Tax=uncultured Citricoccus sp. TaxID=614031 RepID=UPI0026103389|nr:DUF4240 domain-containing protein [uncultured Citricoccus sp.]